MEEEKTGSYLGIIDIVHLVKNHELHIPNKICTLVKHTPQNLCRHDKTVRFRIDLHVTRKDAHRAGRERLFEVSKLLVRKGFYW